MGKTGVVFPTDQISNARLRLWERETWDLVHRFRCRLADRRPVSRQSYRPGLKPLYEGGVPKKYDPHDVEENGDDEAHCRQP
jgi:hypothetical protein